MPSPRTVRVTVEPLPTWLDPERLLGFRPEAVTPLASGGVGVAGRMAPDDAAYLCARLRGLGFDGTAVDVRVVPALSRTEIRAGRLREARARRDTTPGFSRDAARSEAEGRFSLTPEALALVLGSRARGLSVVDACCGSGGNALGFARGGARVTAIEIDPARVAELEHNARLYGIRSQIEVILGDARNEVPVRRADILFIDPPWGEDYDKQRMVLADFPLLSALLAQPLAGYRSFWLKLPASFDTHSLPGFRVEPWFGTADGDAQRVKFLLLTSHSAAPAVVTTGPI